MQGLSWHTVASSGQRCLRNLNSKKGYSNEQGNAELVLKELEPFSRASQSWEGIVLLSKKGGRAAQAKRPCWHQNKYL